MADHVRVAAVFIVRFGSEEDLKQGSKTLDAMNPPTDSMRRVSVETYEVVLDRQAP